MITKATTAEDSASHNQRGGGHRQFWTRQEWRMRLIWPQAMTRPELKLAVLNAALELGFRMIGWQSAEGWHLVAIVEHTWFVDPEVLLKRLAPALLTEGVELRELEIELKNGDWRKANDEPMNIEH